MTSVSSNPPIQPYQPQAPELDVQGNKDIICPMLRSLHGVDVVDETEPLGHLQRVVFAVTKGDVKATGGAGIVGMLANSKGSLGKQILQAIRNFAGGAKIDQMQGGFADKLNPQGEKAGTQGFTKAGDYNPEGMEWIASHAKTYVWRDEATGNLVSGLALGKEEWTQLVDNNQEQFNGTDKTRVVGMGEWGGIAEATLGQPAIDPATGEVITNKQGETKSIIVFDEIHMLFKGHLPDRILSRLANAGLTDNTRNLASQAAETTKSAPLKGVDMAIGGEASGPLNELGSFLKGMGAGVCPFMSKMMGSPEAPDVTPDAAGAIHDPQQVDPQP